MYGLIGRMTAKTGKREQLGTILVAGISGMPGCLSYIVANDPKIEDVLFSGQAAFNPISPENWPPFSR